MAGKMDQAKGRLKEAGGALTGNESLKREGKRDQAAGKVKEAATKVVDGVKKALSGALSTCRGARGCGKVEAWTHCLPPQNIKITAFRWRLSATLSGCTFGSV
jgi:uncharacterized protein YjbJ (UPF0337 family)